MYLSLATKRDLAYMMFTHAPRHQAGDPRSPSLLGLHNAWFGARHSGV